MRTRGQEGLTLLELVVAISVFALAVGGLVMTIDSGLGLARTNRHRSIAANLAAAELDAVRRTPFTQLPLGQVVRTEPVDGVPYQVVRESTWVDNDSETGPCDSAGTVPKVLRVVVAVSWPDMRGIPPVRATTILSPPVGSYDPNTGHLAVAVRDRSAQPLEGVPVTVRSGGVHRLLTTTSEGCAFFAFLPPGTYDVTLERAGYVDRQGAAIPTQTVGVHLGETASAAFDFDQAATVVATLSPAAAGAVLPGSVPLTWANPGLVPDGVRRSAGTGPTRTLGDLFPYADGYVLWAGGCADADPEGRGADDVPFWPGASRPPAVAVSPGDTATATVAVTVAEITVTDLSGPGPVEVIAEHAPDAGCPDGETYTLGTVDGAGTLLVALPHGTWTVRVPGRTWTGATSGDPVADPPLPPRPWPELVLDPRTTGTAALVLDVV
jgi:type II secretory pathway pseudopilin PulG